MEVVSRSPLPVGSLRWQSRPGAWVLTVVAKATYQIQPGKSTLAADQEPVHEEDNHWNDDEARSLYVASDLSPVKPRADVVLVGSAYAPQGQPVRSLFARLVVGDINKSIEVHQDRTFNNDGTLVEGQRFARMSLAYERAAGGPDTSNPVGIRSDIRDAYGRIKLPNLQPPGITVLSPGMIIPPVGFGPIPPSWPIRHGRLGRHAGTFSMHSVRVEPLPEDLDLSHFNAAPVDQQLADLPDDARIVLENMHPQLSRLVTSLPGLRPRAVLEGRGGVHPLALRCDTLWIDTDRMLATLTFRGHFQLERVDEPGRVIITLEDSQSASPGVPAQPQQRSATQPMFNIEDEETGTVHPGTAAPAAPARALPFLPTASVQAVREERPSAVGLPFAKPTAWPSAAPPPPAPPRPSSPSPGWSAPPPPPAVQPPPLPPVQPPAAQPPPAAPPPPVPAKPPPVLPKVVPAKPTADESVWASGMPRPDAPTGQSIGQMVAAASIAAQSPEGGAGIVGASNAAAAAPTDRPSGVRHDAGVRPHGKLDGNEYLHLLWFHADSTNRICRVPLWRAILDEMERERADEAHDVPTLARDPAETEDTRDIFDILARSASLDVDQLEAEIAASVRPGGKFVPPLLSLAGELSFPFDERETLRVIIAVASPVAGTDEVLKSAIREARDFLGLAESCPPPIIEGYSAQLREAFGRGRRSLTPETFEAHVERALLEGRHYQKRQVLGMTAIRALLHTATSTGARPAPVYLPEDLSKRLPLYSRFRTRMIAELYPQEDQHESHPAALKVHAIGRVQPLKS